MITVKKLEEWGACSEAITSLCANGGRASAKRIIKWCEENYRSNWLTWLIASPACEEMLKGGADVNGPDSCGWTPLHWAAASREKACAAKPLIERGANVNALDGFGRTPLVLAEYYGNREIAKLLKEHGGK